MHAREAECLAKLDAVRRKSFGKSSEKMPVRELLHALPPPGLGRGAVPASECAHERGCAGITKASRNVSK